MEEKPMPSELVSKELLEILACPVCKADVKPRRNELVCVKCKRRYPVIDGIPHMLPDELREKL
jgi:hypothetical protein